MPPIRIAFIGLSAGGGWGKNAHLPYLMQTSKYTITGICNSSKQSSEAAIQEYGLASSTKAYASVEELAEDGDSFDLAVCAVRVDKHHAAIKPAVLKGKAAFVEWPLGKNLKEAQDLLDTAKESGSAWMLVGLQARQAPIVLKLKKLVSQGAIGRVLSSTVSSSAGNLGQVDPERLGRLLNDPAIQATMLTIHFGHTIDFVLYALGQDLSSISGILSTQRKVVQLKHPDGKLEDSERKTPDHILLQGHLKDGGLLSVYQRGGAPFKGEPGLRWRIYGQTGEIEVTSDGSFLQVGYPHMEIRLHNHEKDTVETVDFAPNDEFESLPLPARNVARLYEAYADSRTDAYPDWKDAVANHTILEKIMESSETDTAVSL